MHEEFSKRNTITKFEVNEETFDSTNFSFINNDEIPHFENIQPYTSDFENEYFLIKYERLFNFARDKLSVYDELQDDQIMYITETKNLSDKVLGCQGYIYELSDSIDEIASLLSRQFEFIENKYGNNVLEEISKKYDEDTIKQRIKLLTDMALDIQDRIVQFLNKFLGFLF